MKYFIILITFLIFSCSYDNIEPISESYSCKKDTIFVYETDTSYIECQTYFSMNISDSLPIKFWLNEEVSYNNKSIPGVANICFKQKFDCDDPLKLYFEPNIISPSETSQFNSYFSVDFSGWANGIGNGSASAELWDWNSGVVLDAGVGTAGTDDDSSYFLYSDNNGEDWPAGTYTLDVKVQNTSYGGNDVSIQLAKMTDASTVDGFITLGGDSITVVNGDPLAVKSFTFTLTESSPYVGFRIVRQGTPSSFGFNFKITEAFFEVTTDEIAETYELRVLDQEGVNKGSVEFVDYVEVVPSDYGICNDIMSLSIYDNASPQNLVAYTDYISILRLKESEFPNPSFDLDGQFWDQLEPEPGTTSWTFGGGNAVLSSLTNYSYVLYRDIVVNKGHQFNVFFNITVDSLATINIVGVKEGGVVEVASFGDMYQQSVESPSTFSQSVTLTADDDYIGIGIAIHGDGFFGTNIQLHEFNINGVLLSFPVNEIKYWNNSLFDGIPYGEGSPEIQFTAYIDSQFWKETADEEFEDDRLSSNSFVRVYNEQAEKTLLEIGYVPNYMHKKIRRILMHDNVVINGKSWIKRDEYEHENLNRYPLSRANVWLTDKNSIVRNVV